MFEPIIAGIIIIAVGCPLVHLYSKWKKEMEEDSEW